MNYIFKFSIQYNLYVVTEPNRILKILREPINIVYLFSKRLLKGVGAKPHTALCSKNDLAPPPIINS